MELNPIILEEDGEKKFVILSYKKFKKLQEALEDYENLKELRFAKAKEGNAPGIPLEEIKKMLEMKEN
jgi:PHD/YefM family antitoxin component YafN of YafNO toxin-antitoxin module